MNNTLVVVLVGPWLAAAAACSGGGGDTEPDGGQADGAVPDGGQTPDAAEPGPDGGPPPLVWSPCADLPGAECATLEAPLDYDDPGRGTIEIAVSRVAASDPARRIGPLVLNPGGPGQAGRSLVLYTRDLLSQGGTYADVLARFDLVGFDPRGALASTAVDCGDLGGYHATDFTPDDATELDALRQTMSQFAAACQERSGALLAHVDTGSAARDVDRLRAALGEEQLSYLGYSYGTVLGAAYAELFPDRVRALVLDGAVDPNLDGAELSRQQAGSIEVAFAAFAADCDARPECAARFSGGLAATFDRIVAEADAAPLVVPSTGAELTAGQFVTAVALGLYRLPWTRTFLEQGIEDAATGNGEAIAALFAGGYPANMTEAVVAINCADLGLPDADTTYDEFLPELLASAPRFGQTFLREILPCAHWASEPRQRSSPHAAGAAPILVLGTTGDPACPLAWAEGLADQLESGVLLTRQGVGHTAYGHGNPCIDELVNAYLLNLTVPEPPDRFCGAVP